MRKFTKVILILIFSLIELNVVVANPSYWIGATLFGGGNNFITYNIYLRNMGTENLEYTGGKYSFELDPAIVNGGTISYQIISSDLPARFRPVNPQVVFADHRYYLTLDSNRMDTLTSGINVPAIGIIIARVKINSTVNVIHPDDISEMNWSGISPFTSKVFAFVNDSITNVTSTGKFYMDFMFPVELSLFTSSVNKNNVSLNWSTISETNNSGFEIHRKTPGSDWQNIGFVNGAGNTQDAVEYEFSDKGLNFGKYNYRLKQIDYNGNYEIFELTNEVNIGAPEKYFISQNYPNPFNPSTRIDYGMISDGNVKISLMNIEGRELEVLVNEYRSTGYHTLNFNARNIPSGIYFYRIETGKFVSVKKMILLK